jgi:hypothetical protein
MKDKLLSGSTDKSLYLYVKSEIRKKYIKANESLGGGVSAHTSVSNKAQTASPQWIEANWDTKKHGSTPKTAGGRTDVRASLAIMFPPALKAIHTGKAKSGQFRSSTAISTPYSDDKGRDVSFILRQDVDEFVARNQGGSTIKINASINNQGGLNAWANSTAGSSDQGLVSSGGVHLPIKRFAVYFINDEA